MHRIVMPLRTLGMAQKLIARLSYCVTLTHITHYAIIFYNISYNYCSYGQI